MSSNNNVNLIDYPATFVVSEGGTGDTSFTPYSVICSGTSGSGALQNVTGLGTTGQFLIGNQVGLPTWGSRGTGSGVVLQIISTTKTSTFTTTSSTFTDVTGLSVSITPSSSSNKVLVFCHVYGANENAPGFIRLVRGSTAICVGNSNGSNVQATSGSCQDSSATSQVSCASMVYLDSPSTTSSTTYKIQATVAAGGGTYYINEASSTLGLSDYTFASTITVWEVS